MNARSVAQIFNLPYRGFSTCVTLKGSMTARNSARPADCKSAIQQAASLRYRALVATLLLVAATGLRAQTYEIPKFTVGGSGTSTGGVFSVSVAAGQADAGNSSSCGGVYDLAGGFWGVAMPVQDTNSPPLTVSQPDFNTVIISWPEDAICFVLQQNTTDVTQTNAWSNVGQSVVMTNGQNVVTLTMNAFYTFYRLKK